MAQTALQERELKFRAWDETNKKWAYEGFNLFGEVTIFDLLKQYQFEEACKSLSFQQYTGLNDKNGKEGYHKDIVRSGKKLYSIEWQNEEARFWLAPYGNNTGTWQFMDMLKSFEIIGNIYETTSLIN
jgi:hypothetical protein